MNQKITSIHNHDVYGNPAGGHTTGLGIDIKWQDGPLAVYGVRLDPNGAFVEGVISAALDRLRYYQGDGEYNLPGAGKFKCRQNALAITKLEEALHWCQDRTAEREGRGVEGTHSV